MADEDPIRGANMFGAALRRYRTARRMSQLDLALTCDVSARHISFLETGRAQPSRDMVLYLAAGLMLPLGTRNALMRAAGFAPAFPVSALESAELEPLRAVLAEMMSRHSPWPALLCDRYWTLHNANPTGWAMLAPLIAQSGERNLIRLFAEHELAPALIANRAEVLHEMHGRLLMEAMEAGHDPMLEQLTELLGRQLVEASPALTASRRPLVPVVLNGPSGSLRFLTAVTQFGTSEDVTVRDLRLELLFPADDATRSAMIAIADAAASPA